MLDHAILTFVAALLIPIAVILLARRRRGSKKHKLPPLVPLGWITTTTQMTSSDAPWFMLEWARKIGYVYRVRIPHPAPIVIVGDPVLARVILNDSSTIKPYDFYGPIDIPIGATSILTANAFEYEMKEEEAKIFIFELDLVITEYELKQTTNPLRGTWLGYLFAYSEIRRAQEASRKLRGILDNMLQTYRKRDPATKTKGTVIDCIENNLNYLNDKERIADMVIFLVAGHDATAYSIAWALLELARNKPVLANVRSKLTSLDSEDDRLKCDALDFLIKEAMRLHPAAAVGGFRETKREFHVDSTTVIPKGSIVFVATILSHRNPQYFDEPDKFLPDRWKNAKQDAASIAFMPYIAGPRNCAGQALAIVVIHTVLARLVAEYDLEVIDPGKPNWTLSLKPLGVLLKAKKV